MSDPEVLDLTVDEEDKKKAPKLDLAALAREREARRRSRGDGGDGGGVYSHDTPDGVESDGAGRTSSSARGGGAREKRRHTSVRTARSSR